MNSHIQKLRQQTASALRKPWIRMSINVVGAMLLWGSWAAIVHLEYPLPVQLRAAFTQAAISGGFTFIGVALLEAIFARTSGLWRVPLAGIGTFTFIFCSVVVIHLLSGTPNIVLTIAPTMTLSFFYCLGYAASLARLATQTAPTAAPLE